MKPETVDGLREEASRGDYGSMARLARALYGCGLGPREVVRECYGVDFPEEFFALVDAGPWVRYLLVYFTNQPWQLAVPPERGGPAEGPDEMADTELLILARDPDLMPLFQIPAYAPGEDDRVVCYRLAELRAGRPTLYCLDVTDYPGIEVRDTEAVRCGESMLTVLEDAHADDLRRLEEEARLPSNRGAGSVDRSEVDQASESLELVRELARKLAGPQAQEG
ncbi:hypothetical protein [Streptomyces sp. NPDC002054]|uniref:hypothetical protein n=1 Tax=Streptomyces sp. NPDC002054 TaxID=3154663 RepID=UPI00331A4148